MRMKCLSRASHSRPVGYPTPHLDFSVHGFGKNGLPFEFHRGLPVDATGELLDSRTFADVRDFKRLLLEDEAHERQIALNLIQQLVIYATGAPCSATTTFPLRVASSVGATEIRSMEERAKTTLRGAK